MANSSDISSHSTTLPLAPVVSTSIPYDKLTSEQQDVRKIYNILCDCYDYLKEEDDWDTFQSTIDDFEYVRTLIHKWSWTHPSSTTLIDVALNNTVKALDAYTERNAIIYNKKYLRTGWEGTDEDYEIFKENMLDEVEDYFDLREIAYKSVHIFLRNEFDYTHTS